MVALVMLASFWVIAKVAIWVRVGLLCIGPTNWLDAYLHTRRGMKWGVVCWPLAGLCVLGSRFIEASAPAADPAIWQVFLWGLLWFDALKLVRMGTVSVALLVRAWIREARAGRWACREHEYERSGVIGAPGDR